MSAETKLCCGEPMYRQPSDGYWRCRVKIRIRQRARIRARWADGSQAQMYARKLFRGERIFHQGDHHKGVAALLGDRPEGMEVSRTCSDGCPDSWVGYSGGKKKPHWLCVPAHYVYETRSENHARKGAK